MPDADFDPMLVVYCCRHCAYAAADLAGGLRIQYPPGVRIIDVPCTGRVDVVEMLHAFEQGADGVIVAGWLEGDCHYLEGNVNAKRRVEYVAQLLEQIGLEGDRVAMANISSAMGAQFAELMTNMVGRLREFGPSPLRET